LEDSYWLLYWLSARRRSTVEPPVTWTRTRTTSFPMYTLGWDWLCRRELRATPTCGFDLKSSSVNRAISPRNNLKYNQDGSLTLYFQNETPGKDKEANWLPAPKGDFIAMLRMYWPKEKDPSILNGTWQPPPVMRVS